MIKIDKLTFKDKPIKDLSIEELYEVIECAYACMESMRMTKMTIKFPLSIAKKDDSNKRRVWVEKLNSWILVPKELDILHEEYYIQKVLDRAKKFKKIAKERKLDVMPMTDEPID